MILDDIKNQIEFIPEDEANILRELYIEHFIDTNKEGYKKNITERKLFSDGYCYTGYLWGYLKKSIRLTMSTLLDELLYMESVLILWDTHSCDKILIEDYWKFGKDNVIKVDTKYLEQSLNFFPEDIYIFDYDFAWTYIITHEDDGKRRICLKVD